MNPEKERLIGSEHRSQGAVIRIDFTRTTVPTGCMCCISADDILSATAAADTRYNMSLRGLVSEREHSQMMESINETIRTTMRPAAEAASNMMRWMWVPCAAICLMGSLRTAQATSLQEAVAAVDRLNSREMLDRGVQYRLHTETHHHHAQVFYVTIEIAPDARRSA